MKRIVLVLFMISSVLVLIGQPVNAQAVLEAENMQIDIWPEYDRSDALVIYRFNLSSQTSLPAQLSLRIPREAVQPYNVAYKDVDNKLYVMQYNTTVEGDWLRITATTPSLDIQFEYYDPRVLRSGSTRQYEYRWPGDLKVKNMIFRVQQPVNASGMKISPQQGTQSIENNLTHFTVAVGAVDAGTGFNFQISYSKTDNTLSAGSQPVQASDSTTSNLTGSSGLSGELNTVIIGFAVGVVLIAAGLFWYFRTQRRDTAPAGRRRHSVSGYSTSQQSQVDSGKSVYCHQCGKRSNPGDAFCRACGTKLRIE